MMERERLESDDLDDGCRFRMGHEDGQRLTDANNRQVCLRCAVMELFRCRF